ncbi:Plant protein 1589 of unknown function [Striga hermonthica]|uniref:Angiotensin-converting enzyme 2 n=1 Tax=Striga hermonthica TaxID=68872 RepID=A0A9N7NJ30_STRHE|nr:Plant protein 1589 of unknown function [Striga hermonthica]
METGDIRKVSVEDIQLVQNLIERCLQLYMSREEVVSTLLHQAKIEPGFTELVWQKLEAENPEFFRAYHMRLVVKDQIIQFNQLLERQFELMHRVSQTGVASISMPNGSHIHLLETEQCACSESNLYTNYELSLQPFMQLGLDTAGHADVAIKLEPDYDDGSVVIKSEPGYKDSSNFVFGSDENLLESRDAIGETSVSPFNEDHNSPPVLSETVLEQESSSFGFLGQIPRNFSLSDLTADFSSSNGCSLSLSLSLSGYNL